jgi:Fe-S-cluster containining protein
MKLQKNKFLHQNSSELEQQFLELSDEQLDGAHKFALKIRQEYIITKAAQGSNIAVLTAHKSIDTILEEALADTAHPISCFNCKEAYCCHSSVEICEAEAKLIAQYCIENKIKIPKKYLQQQLNHNRHKIAYTDCSACVFLNKEKRCSIYYVRPAACRIHHVATPLEYCDTKNYQDRKITFVNSNAAQVIKSVLFEEGGKVDRMPKLLLKYSQ